LIGDSLVGLTPKRMLARPSIGIAGGTVMRRLLISLAILASLILLPGGAMAARPVGQCPNASSGYFLVDQQTWWDRTVAGFEAEGIPVYVNGDSRLGFTAEFDAFAADAGFGDGQGLYDFVWVDQWLGIDKNGNLMVCMKDRPHTPGNPAFFFNGVDDTAH
jgi:hypothetical protein